MEKNKGKEWKTVTVLLKTQWGNKKKHCGSFQRACLLLFSRLVFLIPKLRAWLEGLCCCSISEILHSTGLEATIKYGFQQEKSRWRCWRSHTSIWEIWKPQSLRLASRKFIFPLYQNLSVITHLDSYFARGSRFFSGSIIHPPHYLSLVSSSYMSHIPT